MGMALEGVPEYEKALPNDIVRVRIDRETGLLTNKQDETSMFEYFLKGTEPKEYVAESISDNIYSSEGGDELF